MTKSSVDSSVPTRIANEIQVLINRGTLSPGVHLGQAEFAERFSTSRVPVREALKLLAEKGSLVHDQNRGFFVAQLSTDEARQLYRLRHLLELELLSTVEWPNDAKIRSLVHMIEDLEKLIVADSRIEWAAKHREFHVEVFGLSTQKLILKEVIRLWSLTDRYRSLLLATGSPKGHSEFGEGCVEERSLVAALKAKDRNRLLAVYDDERNHVESILLNVLRDRGL